MKFFSDSILKAAAEDENYWSDIFKRIFSGEDGRKALLYLFEESGIFNVSADDSEEKLLRGKRAIVLEILDLINADPAEITVAGKEALSVIERAELEQFGE